MTIMDNDLRRAEALTRDEHRLRVSLERHAANTFDLNAVRAVRAHTRDLLETLSFLAQDDAFWRKLEDQVAVLGTKELAALASFDDFEFGALLIACGYRTPPPPPVNELIAEVRTALAAALDIDPTPEVIAEARRRLFAWLYRVRRQIQEPDDAPGRWDAIGCAVHTVGRRMIPIVAGVAAAAAVGQLIGPTEGVTVGSVIGAATAKALEELARRGTEWAAAMVIHSTPPQTDTAESGEPGRLLNSAEVVAAHLASANEELRRIDPPGGVYLDRAEARLRLREIDRQLSRVLQLCGDHNGSSDTASAARLARLAASLLLSRFEDSSMSWIYQEPTDGVIFGFARRAMELALESTFEPRVFGHLDEDCEWRLVGDNSQLRSLWSEWERVAVVDVATVQGGQQQARQVSPAQEDPVVRYRAVGSS